MKLFNLHVVVIICEILTKVSGNLKRNLLCNLRTDPCKCEHNTLDLSGRNLRHLAHLLFPNGTTCINFNNNNFRTLDCTDWLYLPKSLKYVFFKNCKIQHIADNDSFAHLPELYMFDVSYNNLTEQSFRNVLESVAGSHVESLDISGFPLNSRLSNTLFSVLQKLKELYMDECNISSLQPILGTNTTNHYLTELHMKRNLITETSLETFYKYGNYYPKLCILKLSSNPIAKLLPGMFSRLRTLRKLWLDNLHSRSTTFPGVKSSTLQWLDISNSFLFHPVENCQDVFKSSHNLTVLNLTGINLSTNWSETKLLRLFLPLKSINTLILSNTSMKIIPSDVFNEIDSLQVLDLSRNAIEEWKTQCFQNMSKRFKELYLNDNCISVITETTFPLTLLQQLTTLHLNGNNFRCDCAMHWFRYWMKANYRKLDELSKCRSPPEYNNTRFIDFDPYYEYCFGFSLAVEIALFIAGICFVFIWGINLVSMIRSHFLSKGCIPIINSKAKLF